MPAPQTGPAFMLIADRFASTGAYGTSEYGTAPYGGQDWPPYFLPTLVVPSDDLTKSNRPVRADIVHERLGVTVAARKWAVRRKWHVAHAAITQAEIDQLLAFHAEGRFYLLPTGDPGFPIPVRWVGAEPGLTPLRNGLFDIAYTIEETVS